MSPSAPSLATYQSQAQSIYAPQQQAEQTSLTASHQANLNTLNAEKAAVDPTYALQEASLQSSVQQQAAQINQTYSERLLGNFSGLQGNDMGQMFAKANLQEQTIQQQRTDALNSIATQVANEDLTYNADVAALTPKYQSLENQYANSAYSSAVNSANTQAYQDANLQLKQESINNTANYDAAKLANTAASGYKATPKTYKYVDSKGVTQTGSHGYSYTGPNGQSLNLGQWAAATQGGDPNSTLASIVSQLRGSSTSADKQALTAIDNLVNNNHYNAQQVLSWLSWAGNNKNWSWSVDFAGTNF